MMIELNPNIAAGLTAVAANHGLSVEDFLKELIAKELPDAPPDTGASDGASGMVWESGLFIYGAGTALPAGFIDNALRRSRDERSQNLLGFRS
jgi:hypothetical protein